MVHRSASSTAGGSGRQLPVLLPTLGETMKRRCWVSPESTSVQYQLKTNFNSSLKTLFRSIYYNQWKHYIKDTEYVFKFLKFGSPPCVSQWFGPLPINLHLTHLSVCGASEPAGGSAGAAGSGGAGVDGAGGP